MYYLKKKKILRSNCINKAEYFRCNIRIVILDLLEYINPLDEFKYHKSDEFKYHKSIIMVHETTTMTASSHLNC